MDSFIFYVLTVYFMYHLLTRSELLNRPRAYVVKAFPWWVTKPVLCVFCFTFWVSVAIAVGIYLNTGTIVISTIHLMAAPVAAFVLDVMVEGLMKWLAPSPTVVVTDDLDQRIKQVIADQQRVGGMLR